MKGRHCEIKKLSACVCVCLNERKREGEKTDYVHVCVCACVRACMCLRVCAYVCARDRDPIRSILDCRICDGWKIKDGK